MRRSPLTLLAAPALVLALLGAGCGDDEGNPATDDTQQPDDGADAGDAGSQTNSDEGRGEGEEGSDDLGPEGCEDDGGAGQSDGEDGNCADEGGNGGADEAPTVDGQQDDDGVDDPDTSEDSDSGSGSGSGMAP